jgi:hypothetical protein
VADFIDRLGAELLHAANAAHAPGAQPAVAPRKRRLGLRSVARRKRGATVMLLLAVMATPALAVIQPWNPSPRQIITKIGAKPSGGVPTAPVSISTGSPPAQQLGLLGVLRRPATPLDDSPQVARALTQLYGGFNGIEINYVRVLWDTRREGLVLLIPAKSWSGPPTPTGQPSQVIKDVLCLVMVPPSGRGSSGGCEPTGVLTGGHFAGSSGLFEYEVVPDGVAAVKLRFPNGSTETLTVHDNFVAFYGRESHVPASKLPPSSHLRSYPPVFPSSVQWLDAAGRPVSQTQ